MRSLLLSLSLALSLVACRKDDDYDGDGFTGDDCDNVDALSNPGAPEVCDGRDNDCNGTVDDAASGAVTWYTDRDGDGFGDDATAATSCTPVAGAVVSTGDCDDSDPRYHPGAYEGDCEDPNDYDCDGSVANDDGDGDGFVACKDCDDGDKNIHPDADETCDDVDQDCNGLVDDEATDASEWYADLDGDGFGSDAVSATSCDAPDGMIDDDTDCDDLSAKAYPNSPEACDGIDNDCDGTIDDGVSAQLTWFADTDKDGYGDPNATVQACVQPAGFVEDDEDCDDKDNKFNPGAAESCTDNNDYNCDGSFGKADNDNDGAIACYDCDDSRGDVAPNAPELCDDADNDCDGLTDEDAPSWFADVDGDGRGGSKLGLTVCVPPSGYVSSSDDCDDLDADIAPGKPEQCDGRDGDCNGTVPANEADVDGDGAIACADCDDTDKTAHPGAPEVCGGKDEDCDGQTDESDAIGQMPWYTDGDNDTYGTGNAKWACAAPAGSVARAGDCDDAKGGVYPGASETCDVVDQDCDGNVDDNATDSKTFYLDADGDGIGGSKLTTKSCAMPSGYVATSTDCDDLDGKTYPAATEACDGKDNDCASGVPANEADGDGDGVRGCGGDCNDTKASIRPGATEVCNGADDNCDSAVDEAASVDATNWYADNDSDGYGTGTATRACAAPGAKYATQAGDCDDTKVAVNPRAAEVCNGIDDNCDTGKDTNAVDAFDWYADKDGDGWGDPAAHTIGCTKPAGAVDNDGDCYDTSASAFPGSHQTEIPKDGIDQDCDGKDVCTDLDCDGWADILVSNHYDGDYSTVSRAFFSAAGAYPSWSQQQFPTMGPLHNYAGDFNGDGYVDIVWGQHCMNTTDCNTTTGNTLLYYGSAAGYTGAPSTIQSMGAYGFCSGDLDTDGYQDLIVRNYRDNGAYSTNSYVYWGSATGLSNASRTALATQGVSGCSVGDVNKDGRPDIAFANAHDGASVYAINSFIYINGGSRAFPVANRISVPTTGATNVELVDVNADGNLDAVFANYYNGSSYNVDGYVYYGPAFAVAARAALPAPGSYDVEVADLNKDGWADLVFADYYNGSYTPASKIYWGASTGYSTTRFTDLPTAGALDCELADIDNDGWTDIVFASYYGGSSYITSSQVYWNRNGTFAGSYVQNTTTYGARHVVVQDLDRDGYKDIVWSNYYNESSGYSGNSLVAFGSSHGLNYQNNALPGNGQWHLTVVGGAGGTVRTSDAW